MGKPSFGECFAMAALAMLILLITVSIPISFVLKSDQEYQHAFEVGQMHHEANVVIELNPFESNRQRLGWFEGWIEDASPPDESDGT